MIPKFITDPNPEIFFSENFCVVDLETTNIDKGSAVNAENRLLVSSWYYDGKMHTYRGNEFDQVQMCNDIDCADFIVAHNAKFELQWFQRMGIDISKLIIFDTMIAEYVLNGNLKKPLGLGQVADSYGLGDKDKYIDSCMQSGVCPSQLPISLLAQRVNKDVEQTLGIFFHQREELKASGKHKVFYTKCMLTPVLADIEKNGLTLDPVRVKEEYNNVLGRWLELKTELRIITGDINLNSSKQVAEYLYHTLGFEELKDYTGAPLRTKKGKPKTDTSTILALRARTKDQRRFKNLKVEYNQVNADLTKNMDFFYRVCEHNDCVFTAQFNQAVTATGRLSSSSRRITFPDGETKGVQGQNLPRKYKPLFQALQAGWKIREDDCSQLEFGVAGYLGRDSAIVDWISSGSNIHQFTADTLTRAGEPTGYTDAKSRTFKPLYGGRSGTRAEKAYYEAFRQKFSGITETQDAWINTVLSTKELHLETGQVFYWPDCRLSVDDYVVHRESICNYPVQYLATAEIVPIALTYAWHAVKDSGLQSRIINTIHDSIITELYPPENEEYDALIKYAFTDHVYSYLKKLYNIEWFVPLGVGTKIGDHWNEGEESKYKSVPPYKLEEVRNG